MTVDQAAAYLHVKRHTVLDRIARGVLPATRNGRSIYVLADDLAAMLRDPKEGPR
jgi:excisionase family DNA binding protein